jgi:hypothetical protein
MVMILIVTVLLNDKEVTISGVKNGYSFDFAVPAEKGNLSSCMGISANVSNIGSDRFRIEGWLNDNKWIGGCVYLEPGEIKNLEIIFERSKDTGADVFPWMIGMPGGKIFFSAIDPSKINKIIFRVYTTGTALFNINDIKPFGEYFSPEIMAAKPGFFHSLINSVNTSIKNGRAKLKMSQS